MANPDSGHYGSDDTVPIGYTYDLTEKLRNQIYFILQEVYGCPQGPIKARAHLGDSQGLRDMAIYGIYSHIVKEICESLGVLVPPGVTPPATPFDAFWSYFRNADTAAALRAIEFAIRWIPNAENNIAFAMYVYPVISAQAAARKLNQRFQESSIGYRLDNGKIVRIDSEFLHAEAVEPAIVLMQADEYEGALEEFRLAQMYYGRGEEHYDDCLTNCLKALESTLQKIIALREWEMPGDPKFENLFAEVRKRGLFPSFLGPHLGELKKFLQAVAVIRNKEGAHGAGSMPNEVPEHLVAYQIHLTGSAIVFLIRCNENYGK